MTGSPQSMSGKETGASARAAYHCTECPITWRTGFSGAQDSLKRARASRPYIVSHPARRASTASPVASQKSAAAKRVSCPVRVLRETTAQMRFVCAASISTAKTCSLNFSVHDCVVRRKTFSLRVSSYHSAGYVLLPPNAGANSSTRLPSAG